MKRLYHNPVYSRLRDSTKSTGKCSLSSIVSFRLTTPLSASTRSFLASDWGNPGLSYQSFLHRQHSFWPVIVQNKTQATRLFHLRNGRLLSYLLSLILTACH